jgi:hypothetical protein
VIFYSLGLNFPLRSEDVDCEADEDIKSEPPSSVFIKAEDIAQTASEDCRPSILVLGGCGMIGRNFVAFLVESGLARKVRAADKMIPVMGFFHPSVQKIFDSDAVEFVQADLTKPAHIDKAFGGHTFDYVVNFAAETRYGQPPQVRYITTLKIDYIKEIDRTEQGNYLRRIPRSMKRDALS